MSSRPRVRRTFLKARPSSSRSDVDGSMVRLPHRSTRSSTFSASTSPTTASSVSSSSTCRRSTTPSCSPFPGLRLPISGLTFSIIIEFLPDELLKNSSHTTLVVFPLDQPSGEMDLRLLPRSAVRSCARQSAQGREADVHRFVHRLWHLGLVFDCCLAVADHQGAAGRQRVRRHLAHAFQPDDGRPDCSAGRDIRYLPHCVDPIRGSVAHDYLVSAVHAHRAFVHQHSQRLRLLQPARRQLGNQGIGQGGCTAHRRYQEGQVDRAGTVEEIERHQDDIDESFKLVVSRAVAPYKRYRRWRSRPWTTATRRSARDWWRSGCSPTALLRWRSRTSTGSIRAEQCRDRARAELQQSTYFRIILWATFGLSAFRFVGCLIYFLKRNATRCFRKT